MLALNPQDSQKKVLPPEPQNEIKDGEVLVLMKQLNPHLKFRMFYPPQNTQKVKHRTFTIDHTKATFSGKMTLIEDTDSLSKILCLLTAFQEITDQP